LEIGQVWYGKDETAYKGVAATIQAITARNVQLHFDQVINVDGVKLRGEVMSKRKFKRMFEQSEQGGLF
jgi:hypothetical protein